MKMFWEWVVVVVLSVFTSVQVQGQQSYVNNKQLDCNNHYNTTDGNVCNGVASSCPSYLTFRSLPPYNSPTSIAYLLSSTPTSIASANNISDVDPIPTGTQILVPVNCSCFRNSYYQHNASYVLNTVQTYFSVANNTYQGLTTCQALMSQNPAFSERNLTMGITFQVPLRCACPTANQTAVGVKFLLSYMVSQGEDPTTISQRFGIQVSTLLEANRLSVGQSIYFFTPLLIPLTAQPSPTLLQLSPPSPPPPSPSTNSPASPAGNSSSNKKWIFIGVGVGAACLFILLLVIVFVLYRRRGGRGRHHPSFPNSKQQVISSSGHGNNSSEYLNMPTNSSDNTKSWSSVIASGGLRLAVGTLTVYKLEELQRATQSFSEANRIKASVFRGSFEGDEAAIKVMKGDISLSEDEINLLKRINHSNIIRLSGFCVYQAHTYLVYEYAPSGSLADSLHGSSSMSLSWKQRVQIAHGVADALNYLHNFTHPPYIHKNLKTSNILLDANLRPKVSNFGLARALPSDNTHNQRDSQEGGGGGGGFQLTRHVVGTHGYMAPEYIQNGVITPKLDVFAFGVVLLELLSGREAAATAADDIDKNTSRQELLLSASISEVLDGDNVRDKFKGFMDPSLKKEYPLELAFAMAQLAKSCVDPQINSRPSMAEVSNTLSKILSSALDWDPSDDADQLQHSSSTSLSLRR